jgi:hypothetical protein
MLAQKSKQKATPKKKLIRISPKKSSKPKSPKSQEQKLIEYKNYLDNKYNFYRGLEYSSDEILQSKFLAHDICHDHLFWVEKSSDQIKSWFTHAINNITEVMLADDDKRIDEDIICKKMLQCNFIKNELSDRIKNASIIKCKITTSASKTTVLTKQFAGFTILVDNKEPPKSLMSLTISTPAKDIDPCKMMGETYVAQNFIINPNDYGISNKFSKININGTVLGSGKLEYNYDDWTYQQHEIKSIRDVIIEKLPKGDTLEHTLDLFEKAMGDIGVVASAKNNGKCIMFSNDRLTIVNAMIQNVSTCRVLDAKGGFPVVYLVFLSKADYRKYYEQEQKGNKNTSISQLQHGGGEFEDEEKIKIAVALKDMEESTKYYQDLKGEIATLIKETYNSLINEIKSLDLAKFNNLIDKLQTQKDQMFEKFKTIELPNTKLAFDLLIQSAEKYMPHVDTIWLDNTKEKLNPFIVINEIDSLKVLKFDNSDYSNLEDKNNRNYELYLSKYKEDLFELKVNPEIKEEKNQNGVILQPGISASTDVVLTNNCPCTEFVNVFKKTSTIIKLELTGKQELKYDYTYLSKFNYFYKTYINKNYTYYEDQEDYKQNNNEDKDEEIDKIKIAIYLSKLQEDEDFDRILYMYKYLLEYFKESEFEYDPIVREGLFRDLDHYLEKYNKFVFPAKCPTTKEEIKNCHEYLVIVAFSFFLNMVNNIAFDYLNENDEETIEIEMESELHNYYETQMESTINLYKKLEIIHQKMNNKDEKDKIKTQLIEKVEAISQLKEKIISTSQRVRAAFKREENEAERAKEDEVNNTEVEKVQQELNNTINDTIETFFSSETATNVSETATNVSEISSVATDEKSE